MDCREYEEKKKQKKEILQMTIFQMLREMTASPEQFTVAQGGWLQGDTAWL